MLGDVRADVLRGAGAFGDDDEDVALALLVGFFHVLAHRFEVVFFLRDEDVLRAARDAGRHGEPAAAVAHDFEDDAAAMCRCRVTQLVDGVDDRVRRRVAADRVVRAPDIVVNRARETHDGETRLFRKQGRAAQRPVATDDDEALDAAVDEILVAEHAAFGLFPALAASRPEERAAALDDVADVLALHLVHVLIEQAVVTVVDAPDLDALVERRAHDSARASVHARAVAAARHDCDTFQHGKIPLDTLLEVRLDVVYSFLSIS